MAQLRGRFAETTREDLKVPAAALDAALGEYAAIKRRAAELSGLSTGELQDRVSEIRRTAFEDPAQSRVEYFAIACELFDRTRGLMPHPIQIVAALLMTQQLPDGCKGRFAEIKTGEGKTLTPSLIAGFNACCGKPVEIVTSDRYLARRDAVEQEPFCAALGLSIGVLSDEGAMHKLSRASDVVYGTAELYGFAYLFKRFNPTWSGYSPRFQVGLFDEFDNLTPDRSDQSLRVSADGEGPFSPDALQEIYQVCKETRGRGQIIPQLSADDRYADCDADLLQLYVDSASEAISWERGVNHDVDPDSLVACLLDWKRTGRMQRGMTLNFGLQEFLHIKEGLSPPKPSVTCAELSYPRLISLFSEIGCVSGSFGSAAEADEIRAQYSITGVRVPPRVPSRLKDLGYEIYRTTPPWLDRVKDLICEHTDEGRPVLPIAGTVDSVQLVHDELTRLGFAKLQSVTDVTNFGVDGERTTEEMVVAEAGTASAVTVGTIMLSRGFDVKVNSEVVEAGGLGVLGLHLPASKRVEDQEAGRTARNGGPGIVARVICIDDDPLVRILPRRTRDYLEWAAALAPDDRRKAIEFLRDLSGVVDRLNRQTVIRQSEELWQLQESYLEARSKLLGDWDGSVKRKLPPAVAKLDTWWVKTLQSVEVKLNSLQNGPVTSSDLDAAIGSVKKSFRAAYRAAMGHPYKDRAAKGPRHVEAEAREIIESFVSDARSVIAASLPSRAAQRQAIIDSAKRPLQTEIAQAQVAA